MVTTHSKSGAPVPVLISFLILLLSGVGFAQSGIVLDKYWESPPQAGSATMKDLATLLSPFAQAAPNLAPDPAIEIYSGITYLMPLAEAKGKLNLTQKTVPKNVVTCAGFPKASIFHYCFEGIFEGHYNKLYLVTDMADQVVAVQLVAESPKRDQVESVYNASDWHTHNFITLRTKATTKLWISNTAWYQTKSESWLKFRPTSTSSTLTKSTPVIRIDTLLMDPDSPRGYSYRGSDWKALEAGRLYLPRPLAELILHCIQKVR